MNCNIKNFLFLPVLVGNGLLAQEKPNILWITIEDTSPQFIGCYDNPDARTPVIDQLAGEGVRFTNAFSTGTVCSPSRSTIITGVKTYKSGTGNHRSSFPLPGYIRGFPYYLQEAGYYTTNNSKTDYNVANPGQFTNEAWNESSNKAGWWNRKAGQPFFAVFNFMESHQSRTMTESYSWYLEHVLDQLPDNDRIESDEFIMPPFYLDSPEMRRHFARVYNSIKLTDNRIGELFKRLEQDKLRDSTIIFFFSDHGQGIPRGKTNGINLGYRVPFIIWFPEIYKHLSPWGTGGLVSSELIDFEDLAPTMISLAEGKVPGHMQGRVFIGKNRSEPVDHLVLSSDRSDNGIDMTRSVTDGKFLYSRNFMPYMNEARYIRYMEIGEIKQQMREDLAAGNLDQLQKSLFEPRPAEFLFDIEKDLWETINLATDPAYSHVLKKMRGQLQAEIFASRDILFLPEYELEKISESVTPYEFRLSDDTYPLEAIYGAASLSGLRGEDIVKRQIKMLGDPNSIIRYWAIVGLKSQQPGDLQGFARKIFEAMEDEFLPVSVTASAIAYKITGSRRAALKLKEFCESENPNIALMAINYLLYTDDREPFAETIQKVYGMEGRNYDVRAACLDFLGSIGLIPNTPDYRD
jgi:arylsulfatase A-like enzyme